MSHKFYSDCKMFYSISNQNFENRTKERVVIKETYVMQTKLILTIEESIIEQAKLYAKGKGRSLPELIENQVG